MDVWRCSQGPQLCLRLVVAAALFISFLAPLSSGAAPWDLDPSFGTGGAVVTSVGGYRQWGSGIAVRPDGRIVVGGGRFLPLAPPTPTPSVIPNTGADFAVVQYHTDGSLDDGFGDGGAVVTVIGQYDDVARALLVLPDGRLVQGGCSFVNTCDVTLVRFGTDGGLDPAFGAGGIVVSPVYGSVRGIAAQGDKLIVAAELGGMTWDFAVGRFAEDGALDLTFGDDGWAIGPASTTDDERAAAVVVQSDDKPVAAGTDCGRFTCDLILSRYDENGGPDPDFASGGVARVALGRWNDDVGLALLADGKLVVATEEELIRFDPDGTLDSTFGAGGVVNTRLPGSHRTQALLAWPDGRVVTASRQSSDGSLGYFRIRRYRADGALDLDFAPGGELVGPEGEAVALARTPDGKIVAAGQVFFPALPAWESKLTVARYAAVAECGNGVVEPGEDCDGSDDGACPGQCNLDQCLCPFSATRTPTMTVTPTWTFTMTPSWVPPPSPTWTPSVTPTRTPTRATPTRTLTLTPTWVPPPSPTWTPSGTPTRTPTATVPAGGAAVNMGDAGGNPGDTVTIAVTLADSGGVIVATSNDITYDPTQVDVAIKPNLKPDCTVDESIGLDSLIGKSLSIKLFDAVGNSRMLRVGVLATDNVNVIPDGPLYTCKFKIAAGTTAGAKVLTNLPGASDAASQPVTVGGTNGAITVGGPPEPTHTATRTPSLSPTPTGTPTRTPTRVTPTWTFTMTPSWVPPPSPTWTPSGTPTPTPTGIGTEVSAATRTPSGSPTATGPPPTGSATSPPATRTATAAVTGTPTAQSAISPTYTPSVSPSPSAIPAAPTATGTGGAAPTETAAVPGSPTATSQPTPTRTAVASPSPTSPQPAPGTPVIAASDCAIAPGSRGAGWQWIAPVAALLAWSRSRRRKKGVVGDGSTLGPACR